MTVKSSVKIKQIVLTVVSTAFVAFIFYNSSCDAGDSSRQSLFVLDVINDFLTNIDSAFYLTEFFVRKLAHFTEFFVLGTLLFFTVRSYLSTVNFKIILAPVVGLAVAALDETIQLFVPGRSCQLSDVILDFCGVCTAVALFVLIGIINNNHKKVKRGK